MTEEALFKEEVLKTLATKITEEKFIFYNDVFNLYNDEISQIPDNKEPLTPEELFQIFEKESATLKEKYNLTVNKGKDFRGFEKLDLGLDVDEDITKYCSLVFDTEQCKIIVGWMPVYDFFHFYEYKKVLKLLDIFFGCDTSPLKMRINTIKDKYQMNFKSAEIAKNTVELFARQLLTSKGISYKVIYSANTGTLKIRKSQELIYEIGFSFPEINSNPAAFINLLKDIKPLAGEELYCVEKVDFYA